MFNPVEDEKEENENIPKTQQHHDTEDVLKSDDGGDDEDEDEDEDAYRLRVYGYVDKSEGASPSNQSSEETSPLSQRYTTNRSNKKRGESFRKFSKRMSTRLSRSLVRRSSSVTESLPDTPQGWAVFSGLAMSAILAYETRLQRSLTKPPITFCQLPSGSFVEKIYEELTEKSPSVVATKILSRTIQPSLFVGTRGLIASTVAYLHGGPSSETNFIRFREIFTMSQDRAQIAVDWEFREEDKQGHEDSSKSKSETSQQEILNGVIRRPVVIILHGINNDSSFGYMKSLSRSFCNRGYISASVNFRGCGGQKLVTPRGYTGAYTGDIRSLVRQLSVRLGENVSMFLVGNSLGANIMTKYLGEEGMMGTLPSCVSGAASLGNPLLINSKIVRFPFNVLMALGVKKIYLENWRTLVALNDKHSKETLKNGFLAPTIAAFDEALAPSLIRNNTVYPYETRIGYDDGEAYWFDASSYRYVRHISVPFLNITAQDDFIVSTPSRNKLGFCLANPNVMNVETRCGGHLGWQEAPPDSAFGASSWADTATSDFFDAVLKVKSDGSAANSKNRPVTKSTFDYPEPPFVKGVEMAKTLDDIKREAIAFNKTNFSKL